VQAIDLASIASVSTVKNEGLLTQHNNINVQAVVKVTLK
jgi:hypothetical protein